MVSYIFLDYKSFIKPIKSMQFNQEIIIELKCKMVQTNHTLKLTINKSQMV